MRTASVISLISLAVGSQAWSATLHQNSDFTGTSQGFSGGGFGCYLVDSAINNAGTRSVSWNNGGTSMEMVAYSATDCGGTYLGKCTLFNRAIENWTDNVLDNL